MVVCMFGVFFITLSVQFPGFLLNPPPSFSPFPLFWEVLSLSVYFGYLSLCHCRQMSSLGALLKVL